MYQYFVISCFEMIYKNLSIRSTQNASQQLDFILFKYENRKSD